MSRKANLFRAEISSVTQLLTQVNLTVASQNAELRIVGRTCEVGWSKDGPKISQNLKDISYSEIYNYCREEQQYNFILPDGGLIQLLYRFQREKLLSHRVCYLPPVITEATDEETEVMLININSPLIRIDYSPSEAKPVVHSSTHLHLGYNSECRIPTSAPVSPKTFILFILRSFYSDLLTTEIETQLLSEVCFPESLHKDEKKMVHLNVPS